MPDYLTMTKNDNSMDAVKATYESPTTEVVAVRTNGLICESYVTTTWQLMNTDEYNVNGDWDRDGYGNADEI